MKPISILFDASNIIFSHNNLQWKSIKEACTKTKDAYTIEAYFQDFDHREK